MKAQLDFVTDRDYQDYLESPAALILFKIEKCRPCEEFLPVVAETMRFYEGRIRWGVALLHVPGSCRKIKRRHRFETFPTLHFYREGRLVLRVDRKLSFDELNAAVRKHLL